MAALQAPKSSSQIGEKHSAILVELKKGLFEANEGAHQARNNGKDQATTNVSIYNDGVGTIKFQEKKDWSGSVVGSYPQIIPTNTSDKFSHTGAPPKDSNGSMGAVVYAGPNVQGGPDVCAWIMAWSTPGNGSGNKIYIETGPSTKYPPGKIDWDEIKTNLESSGAECHYYDEDSHTEASAQIDEEGNTPKAPAVFDVSF